MFSVAGSGNTSTFLLLKHASRILHAVRVSDEALVQAILTAPSYAAAAQQLGIAPSTIARRIRAEPVASILRERREAAFETATTKLTELLLEAVETIGELMRASTVQDSTRFACAKAVLAHAAKARELDLLAKKPAADESWIPVFTPARDDRPGYEDPRKADAGGSA